MKSSLLHVGLGLFLLSVFAVPAFGHDGSTLRAGSAAVDISPKKLPALQNGGFLQRVTNRVLDPLLARTLVFSDGQETVAIVIVDSCMFPTSLCDQIKQLATKETGIPTDRILISATHTHTAPAAMSCLGCPADEAYVKFVPARVAQSIVEAYRNLQPAKLGWKVVHAPDLMNCRRWITRSDRMGQDPFGGKTVRAMMHPGYQNPNYTSPAGPIDPWLSILSVVSAKDDSPICVLANLSMHYFGGGGFSADYFGEVARSLENRIGKVSGKATPGFVGIMSQGTSGDLHWMDYSQSRRSITRQQYAERVSDRVLKAWQEIEYRTNATIAMSEKRLTIDRRLPSQARREWARPINAARHDIPARTRVEVYAEQAEWIHENPKAEVVLQAVRLGDLGITAIPNEVYGITGLKLKRQSPLEATFNLELANGATGYIPPPEQHRLGGYTTWPARTAGLVEEAEPLIVETLLGLLETVAKKKRRTVALPRSTYSEAVAKKKPLAYWRLEDLYSKRAEDSIGDNHASYHGGVALFLPGPRGSGFRTPDKAASLQWPEHGENNCGRSVYLAGGHIEAEIGLSSNNYSVSMWFMNALPPYARDTTGVLFDNDSESLLIAGKDRGERAGKLILKCGQKTFAGKTTVEIKYWQQLTMTRDGQRVRVYLDGRAEPEIDVRIERVKQVEHLWIGSNGDSATTFDGKVDEIAIFDRTLSHVDVAELYRVSGVVRPSLPKWVLGISGKPTNDASRKKYGDTIRESKPVAFWRLHDQAAEAVAKDSIGKHNAKYEKGASPFQPTDSRRNFTGGRVKASIPELGNTYSVELWFRNETPVGARPVTGYLFSRAVDGVYGAFGDNLGIGGTHSNMGKLFVYNGNKREQLIAGKTSIPVGAWSHVVMVRRDQKITVYLNGDPKPQIEANLPVDYPNDCEDIFLGGRADNFANLQGMLEDVSLYDRALTPQEVVAHFKASDAEQTKRLRPRGAIAPDESENEEPTPTPVENAAETIHVPAGFEVQLVASEPLVIDPVAIDWGADGRLWVVEMADYPLGMDGKGKPGGRVRVLDDADGDGRYDKSTLFAEGLSFPNGILTWGRGVLVTAAPQIVYLEDSNGDGKADVRRVLYSGFLEGNQQLRVNGLRWGLDNWVYCASGSHHAGYGKESRITAHVTGKKHQIGSRDFRVRPDTGDIDPQSGPSQYGRNRDDWGNWFGVQNSHPLWHYVLADHNIRRNLHYAPPNPKFQVVTPANPKVYPASKLQKRYHNFSQSGRFTSACSPMIYRDDSLFARGIEQHAFTCEPFHNLVQHNLIADDGVSFKFRRDPREKAMDFFSSEDRWCRPVMARTGPDGALWVVDMYRYMIEHPQWLPQNGKDELKPWYRSGDDRGRIYRVVRKGHSTRKIPSLTDFSVPELVGILESPNGWLRDKSQRMLVNTKQKTAVVSLKKMAVESQQPLARLHALWTLDGLGELPSDLLEAALADSHAGVRRNALRIASRLKVNAKNLIKLVEDPDDKVRLELASTLGAYDDPAVDSALAKLILDAGRNRYLLAAAMSSLNSRNVTNVLAKAIQDAAIQPTGGDSHSNLLELIGQAVAMGEKESLNRVIDRICSLESNRSAHAKFSALGLVLKGMQKREIAFSELSDATKTRIDETMKEARKTIADSSAQVELRVASVQLMGRATASSGNDFDIMKKLLVPQSPVLLQRAIITHLGRGSEPAIADMLLAGWRGHSPEIRRQVLDVLASRMLWAESLRKKLEDQSIAASELSVPIRQRLLELSKNSPQWQKVLASKASADRAKVLEKFQAALVLDGDAKRGAVLFRKTCISCHKTKGEGHEVGPQLASITDKTKSALLTAILDPSSAVDAKYFSYSVVTNDGRSFTGKLDAETGSSITLLAAEGKRKTLLRRDIDLLQASPKSLMPEGLEQGITPQGMADLIQFVRETFR